MKGKQLGILVVAALVLGGLGWYVRSSGEKKFEESKLRMGETLLGKFDVNAVAGIRITSGTNVLNVARAGETWVVKERGGYPANFGTVADFVRKLADVKITKPLNIGTSRLAALDLVAPGQGAGVLVELLGADGKAVTSLLAGKTHSRGGGEESSPFGGGGAYPDGRYVQAGGDPKNVALISDPLQNAVVKPEEWVAKEFIKVEPPILRVVVTRPGGTNSFTLGRTNEFANWELAEAKPEEKLDPNKSTPYSTVLSAPTFSDVLVNPDAAALGLDLGATAVVTTTAGFTYTLKFGKPQANEDVPVQVTVAAEFAKERTPGKDEKPEDKTKLDKEFADKLAKNQEKLKAEQAFGKWTFLVAKWSLDPLLKNRSELLVDKKAEEAKAAGGAGGVGLPGAGAPPELSIPNLFPPK